MAERAPKPPSDEDLAVIGDIGLIFEMMGRHGITRVEAIDGGGYAVYAKKVGISAPLREIIEKHEEFIVEAGKKAKRARN